MKIEYILLPPKGLKIKGILNAILKLREGGTHSRENNGVVKQWFFLFRRNGVPYRNQALYHSPKPQIGIYAGNQACRIDSAPWKTSSPKPPDKKIKASCSKEARYKFQ